jgi:hypothetical protein
MKRIFCLILALALTAALCACSLGSRSSLLEPVEFFYPRNSVSFIYGSELGILDTELREGAGHTDDLNYLLSMYLRGPQDSRLRNPFPASCQLETVRQEGDILYLVLSSEFTALESTDLTVACAGLTKTSMNLVDVRLVSIKASGNKKSVSITMDAEALLLSDYSAFEVNPVTE